MSLSLSRRGLLAASLGAATAGLVGCSSSSATSSSATAGGSTSFTFWSMWKVGEPQQVVLAQAITDFEKQTGIKVEVDWQGRNNFTKLVPALNTNSVPDLLDGPYIKAYPALVETNQALGLSAAYDMKVDGKRAGDLIPADYMKSINIKLADGAPWMMPYQIQSDAIWYNAAKFPEIKANPPKTWDDFIAVLDKIKSKGEIAPIAADGDIAGYNAAWLSTLILREVGPGGLEKIARDTNGEAWKSSQVLSAASKVEQVVKGGYLIDGYTASKFPLQQQKWADNKAAFIFMGSWLPTESSTYAASGMEYQSFPFPTTGTQRSARVDFSGFVTPKKAKSADAALKFMAFFLSKTYQDAWGSQAKGIPVRSDAAISTELASLQSMIKSASGFHQQNDGVAFTGYNEKTYWPNSDKLFLGKLTAAQFVETMAKDQAAYWKSQGK